MQIKRHRTVCKIPPAGMSYLKVLTEAKKVYRMIGIFAMIPHKRSDGTTLWTAEFRNTPPIKIPVGSVIYKFHKHENVWLKDRYISSDTHNDLYRRRRKRALYEKRLEKQQKLG